MKKVEKNYKRPPAPERQDADGLGGGLREGMSGGYLRLAALRIAEDTNSLKVGLSIPFTMS